MDIPKGTNTGLAMQFLASDVGREWKKTKDYSDIYEALGAFTASLNTYEIPQPEPIVKGVKFIIEKFNQ